jgi:diguanylate cyclase (GGDEF)-like protein
MPMKNLHPRRWQVWSLPRPARTLVVGVICSYAAVLTLGLTRTHLEARPALTTLGFAVAAIISIEVSMRLAWPRTRQDRISGDFLGVWMLPLALLLPPVYVAAMVPIPMLYLQWRAWHGQPVKVTYSVSSIALAYAVVSFVHQHWRSAGLHLVPGEGPATHAAAIATLVLATAAGWIVNNALVAAVVALTAGPAAVRSFLRNHESHLLDAVAACIGILAAFLWTADPVLAALLVPPVLLVQHQLFSGLRKAVRTDLLTDVANPQFWREVVGREVERAATSGASLAVLMVDVDHFKTVNDRFGHLAGDEVLAAVARSVAQALRPGDLVGRLGGEEFGAVLTGLNLHDAARAAERVRAQVAAVKVRSDRGDWIGVTVSVGVAELSVTGGNLHRLLDAADSALYAAKAAGRNCVRLAGGAGDVVIDLTAEGSRPAVG